MKFGHTKVNGYWLVMPRNVCRLSVMSKQEKEGNFCEKIVKNNVAFQNNNPLSNTHIEINKRDVRNDKDRGQRYATC